MADMSELTEIVQTSATELIVGAAVGTVVDVVFPQIESTLGLDEEANPKNVDIATCMLITAEAVAQLALGTYLSVIVLQRVQPVGVNAAGGIAFGVIFLHTQPTLGRKINFISRRIRVALDSFMTPK